MVLSDDLVVFRCTWRSRGWFCDGELWCCGSVFCSEEFDACYVNWKQWSLTGYGAPDHIDCNIYDDKEVVGIETSQWKTTRLDTKGKCTPQWSRVDWGLASKFEGSCGKIHCTGCFRSMEGSKLAACMFLVRAGRHQGSQPHFCIMVWWIATRYLSGFSNCLTAEWYNSATACQATGGVSQTWPGRRIKRGASFGRRQKWKFTPRCTFSTEDVANLCSSSASWWFEVVANQVFCRSCGYIPHVCRNEQWWRHRNAAQIPVFTKSICIHNHSQNGWPGINLTAATHAVITQKLWVLNEQWQAFARGVQLGYNRVPYPWLLSTGSGGQDDHPSKLYQHSGVEQMNVLHSLMSQLNITTIMIYRILESHGDHTSCWQRIETHCSLMNHHLRLLGQFIKVRLFGQSPNIILTDTNSQKGRLYGTPIYCIDKFFPSVIFKANQRSDGGIVWGGFHWRSSI